MENNPLGLAIKELCLKKGLKQMDLAKKMGISPTSLSQIVTGKAKPRQANFTRLCQILSESPNEEQVLVNAFLQITEQIPEAQVVDAAMLNIAERERAERFLEVKTQSIAFKRSVAGELKKSQIAYVQDFSEGIYTTDFLVNQEGKRIAIECKFNIQRDFDKTLKTCEILHENLKCNKVFLVVPFSSGTAEMKKTKTTDIQMIPFQDISHELNQVLTQRVSTI